MENKVVFYIINEEGVREEAQILAKYKLSNEKNYITYTYNEINENQMIKIYSTGIEEENGNYSYREIETTDEWNEIKTVMKDLARDPSSPIPENLKCNLRLSGEEVSVRKPKKLLVSKKFAETLASKYSEEEPIVSTLTDINIDAAVNSPAEFILNSEEKKEQTNEDLLNKTIEIPTFEELQARNKTVVSAMSNARVETPVIEPTPVVTPEPTIEEPKVSMVNEGKKEDYREKFKQEVEPLLLDVYAKQQKQIEELEEELSKTKFDLFEKQKEALSLKKEKDELAEKGTKLEDELSGVQAKMNGILNVIQGTNEQVNTNKEYEEERI